MAISDIATFVLKEYRYAVADDDTVMALSGTQYLELETNLDLAGAQALTTELLADYKRSTMLYQVNLEGCEDFSADSFNGTPPMVQCNLPGFPAKQMRVQSVSIDLQAKTTAIRARG